MQRFRRTSSLVLLVLSCAPMARAADAPVPAPPPATPPATPPPPPAAGPAVPTAPGEPVEMPAVVVEAPRVTTPTRVETPVLEVPRAVDLVDVKRLRERTVASVLDALDDQLGVWVEKRTSTTSDPVIRGLSGGNILALIDGNTLSTFWGEGGFAGDDMYGKIDPDMVERIEVVRGPASVLYGSNALGGVINFITRRSPFDFTECGVVAGGRTRLSGATATHALRARLEAYGASRTLRWLVGGTGWDNGDTVDGSGETQDPSGGHGRYANAAIDWKLGNRAVAGLTLQMTDNDEVYRYYRATQDNANERYAIAPTLTLTDLDDVLPFADTAVVRLYWQDKEDHRRWFDASGDVTQTGVARWETLQAGIQLDKALACHHVTYGVDFQSTWGESPDDEQFTTTKPDGTKTKAAPDSVWSSLGAYVQDVWRIAPRWTVTASARFDVFRMSTDVDEYYKPPGGLDPEEDEFTDYQTALVGGLLAAYRAGRDTTVYGGWTRGFRQFAPHFGVTQHGWGVVVPSQLLDPVTADQFEVGLRHEGRLFRGELVGYHTLFNNFQNVVRGTFQGQDWYDYDQDGVRDVGEDAYVTTGNGEAYVQGIEASLVGDLHAITRWRAATGWTLGGTFAWNYGTDETNDIPIRHTAPTNGTARLRYDHPDPERGLWFEAMGRFVRHYDRIPPDRLANDVGYWEDPQDGSLGKRRSWGLPGYAVFDLRGGTNLGPNATVTVGLENVFDVLYRPAHARWDAPGRSLTLSLEVRF